MKKALIILFTIGFSSLVFAGGDWSEAKIIKFDFNGHNQVVFEFEWIKENGFLSKSDNKRLVFEFHNWPTSSRRWFHQILPWTPSDDQIYSLADVATCQNLILNAYIKKSSFMLGQMGTVPFQPSVLTENAGVVPYAKVIQLDGQEGCMLYAAPI